MSLKSKLVNLFARRYLDGERKKGTMLGKIWDWLNGKKTAFGVIITLLAFLSTDVLPNLGAFGLDAVLVAKVLGVATFVVGLLHKVYKFIYKEEHN